MGQQQLLLIVLSVIIVGVAVAVGVTQFQSSAVDANRQAIIGDLVNLAAKAQRYYRTPQALGGGEQNFDLFELGTLESSNNNGIYAVSSGSAPTGTAAITPGGSITGTGVQTIYITGYGTENGNDTANPNNKVKAYVEVTASGITTKILN